MTESKYAKYSFWFWPWCFKILKHALIYSSFRENITHGLILHLGKNPSWISHTVSLSSKLISDWTREQETDTFRLVLPSNEGNYTTKKQNKGRRKGFISSWDKWRFAVFFCGGGGFLFVCLQTTGVLKSRSIMLPGMIRQIEHLWSE